MKENCFNVNSKQNKHDPHTVFPQIVSTETYSFFEFGLIPWSQYKKVRKLFAEIR